MHLSDGVLNTYIYAPLYLLPCQVRVTVGDSGLSKCCGVCVTSFECSLTPSFIDSALITGILGLVLFSSNFAWMFLCSL